MSCRTCESIFAGEDVNIHTFRHFHKNLMYIFLMCLQIHIYEILELIRVTVKVTVTYSLSQPGHTDMFLLYRYTDIQHTNTTSELQNGD